MVDTEKEVEKNDNSNQLVDEILEDEENKVDIEEVVAYNEREFEEVEGGDYNEEGFYITPNGSFWDPDGIYFNREGYDKHEGYYDQEYNYQPGRGWIPHLLCYEDELQSKNQKIEGDIDLEEDNQYDYDNVDDLHEEVDYGNLADSVEKKDCVIKKNILTFTGNNKPIFKSSTTTEKVETKLDIEEVFKKD